LFNSSLLMIAFEDENNDNHIEWSLIYSKCAFIIYEISI
jgi:hypothetical protein